jgi:hypothetical protein
MDSSLSGLPHIQIAPTAVGDGVGGGGQEERQGQPYQLGNMN